MDVTAGPELGDDGELYRAIFEVNPAVKLLIDPDGGQIVDANQAALRFYGWPLDQLRRMRIADINTLTPAEVRGEMDAARAGARRYFRFRHRIASGDVRHVEVHTGPVPLRGRTLLLSIIHDVTDRDAIGARRSAHRADVGRPPRPRRRRPAAGVALLQKPFGVDDLLASLSSLLS